MVQVNHGATEMGQGVHTNIAMVASKEQGVSLKSVRVMPTSTDKVPNTSATAASCGTDLNGMAVKNACDILRERLAPVALRLIGDEVTSLKSNEGQRLLTSSPTEQDLIFADDFVFDCALPDVKVPFAKVVQSAHVQRIGLSSTGYYRTPEIHYDRAKGQGKLFRIILPSAQRLPKSKWTASPA